MDISAIQAKLLLSQIGGTKELTKANVAQNTKVIQKEQKKGTDSKYTENEINDRADISQEAVSRFYNEMDKNVNDSMENNNYDKNSQTTTNNTLQNSDAYMYKRACRAYKRAC